MVGDVITLAGVVAVMLWMDWRLALVTFSLVPVLVLVQMTAPALAGALFPERASAG